MPLKVFAVNVDYGFYNSNDIIYYDPNACSSSSSSSSSGGGAAETAEQNLEAILKYFTAKGLSLAAAAGIAGNLVMESGLNPAKIEGGAIASDDFIPVDGQGFGLAQWTFTDRQQPLIDLAKTQGKKITDMTLQLDYIWLESTTGKIEMLERLNGIKSETSIGSASAPMAAAIIFHGRTPNTIGSSVQEIVDVNPPYGFEGSGDSASKIVENRGKSAEEYYGRYKGKISDGTGVVGIGSSTVGASSSSSANCNSNAAAGATIDQEKLYEASDNINCAPGTTEAVASADGYTGGKLVKIKLCYIPNTSDDDSAARTFDSVITVNSRVSGAWLALINEMRTATGDNIISASSSFRTPEMQATNKNGAAVGYSNHQMGLAVDFGSLYSCEGCAVPGQGEKKYFDFLEYSGGGKKYGFKYLRDPLEAWHWEPTGSK